MKEMGNPYSMMSLILNFRKIFRFKDRNSYLKTFENFNYIEIHDLFD